MIRLILGTSILTATRGIMIFTVLLTVQWLNVGNSRAAEQDTQTQPMIVHLIRPQGHVNNDYVIELLTLALDKSGLKYTIEPVSIEVEQGREINIVKRSKGTVMTSGTSRTFENEMRPIRIPIYRGMLGYRIGIINKTRQSEFSAIRTLSGFKKMSVGQGIGWSDIQILESAGFKVITANYQQLFSMVARNRYDCFLRGINEAFDEVAVRRKEYPEIAVETDLVLYYPFAMFFFVNKEDDELAKAIEAGLYNAYEDGAFLNLFNNHPQTKSVLRKAKLNRRRLFRIENPTLTVQSRSIPKKYWLTP